MNILKIIFVSMLALTMTACVSTRHKIIEGGNQVKLRSMQTRAFDTTDKNNVVRNVIATLQDLNFVIDKADADLGTVTATKLSGYQIKMTVSVRPKGKTQTSVRANAQYNLEPIQDPVVYQQFFSALQKSLFLTAHSIE
ncbi:hypothetical protein [Algicola sagamiensis]|uniref:hypothetical protein n=1 Tax=Algicola sagamiensis TaxID=163869 RepID=UPI0003629AAB|nr:hypothetical protein [Algicola sagamiensis]